MMELIILQQDHIPKLDSINYRIKSLTYLNLSYCHTWVTLLVLREQVHSVNWIKTNTLDFELPYKSCIYYHRERILFLHTVTQSARYQTPFVTSETVTRSRQSHKFADVLQSYVAFVNLSDFKLFVFEILNINLLELVG